MAVGALSPVGYQVFWLSTPNPNINGFIGTYLAGTSTPTPTYKDSGLTIPNTNPIALDSVGGATIYLDPVVGSYRYQERDAASNLIRTTDPVLAVNAGTSGLGSTFVFGGLSNTPITVTAYVSGATYNTLHPGTAVWFQDSATLAAGTYRLEFTGSTTVGNTVTVALVNLDDGTPDTPIVTATVSSVTGATAQSAPITFATGGVAKHYGIKVKMDAGTGFAWGIRILRTA